MTPQKIKKTHARKQIRASHPFLPPGAKPVMPPDRQTVILAGLLAEARILTTQVVLFWNRMCVKDFCHERQT
ncbi:MAG: hypothetical protein HZA50_00005 [Planctomycetes bacterium]|nr:hypothetical protein [Planctomycetota bacterium]